MKKRKEPIVPLEQEQKFELSQESFSDEEDFEVAQENESEKPEKQPKKRSFKVVLVAKDYVVYDFNGTNSFIERSKIDNKNPTIGDYIEI